MRTASHMMEGSEDSNLVCLTLWKLRSINKLGTALIDIYTLIEQAP